MVRLLGRGPGRWRFARNDEISASRIACRPDDNMAIPEPQRDS